MTDHNDFRQSAHQLVDWIADYLENIENYPVKSQVQPGDIKKQISDRSPTSGEAFTEIMKEFEKVVLPGITHWQSPKFHAYFPGNSSYPSLLGEMLTSAIAAQCMIWETSPAAAELEERVLDWLKFEMGLPTHLKGVIQDTASTATLASILTARERMSDYSINDQGFDQTVYRIYCSQETHSSIEKAVKIAGFGRNNLVKVPVDDNFRMDPLLLEALINDDLKKGYRPICVVATLGTTGTCAIDPLNAIAGLAEKYNLWLHVDAAYAGTVFLLDEYKWMTDGMERADTLVINPHKWMFTNFDCTAYYVRDEKALIRTFEVLPEYLKTTTRGTVNDYRDWGIPLGRRFRALKLWFVIKSFGMDGIREKLRNHIELAILFEKWINGSTDFEVMADRILNLVCFRYKPEELDDQNSLNTLNQQLLDKLNGSGRLYLTHTKVNGNFVLRMVIGQTNVKQRHIEENWLLIREYAKKLPPGT